MTAQDREERPDAAIDGPPATAETRDASAATARTRRIRESAKFSEALKVSVAEQQAQSATTFDPAQPSTSSTRQPYDDGPLRHRIAQLRSLNEPRHELPAQIARFRLARVPLVRSLLLRVTNYIAGPSRRQAVVVADCLDMIANEIRRAGDRSGL